LEKIAGTTPPPMLGLEDFTESQLCPVPWTMISLQPTALYFTSACQASFPREPGKDLLVSDAWNSPAFVEARAKLVAGNWPEVCPKYCINLP
jgi:hypothetical protein